MSLNLKVSDWKNLMERCDWTGIPAAAFTFSQREPDASAIETIGNMAISFFSTCVLCQPCCDPDSEVSTEIHRKLEDLSCIAPKKMD